VNYDEEYLFSTSTRQLRKLLLKATEALVHGTVTVTLTKVEADSIEGFVQNGDGVVYSVILTPARSFCSCRDALFRHSVCKHAVVLALFVIRHPQPTQRKEECLFDLKLTKTRRGWYSA
jgi:SWIM zinc finger